MGLVYNQAMQVSATGIAGSLVEHFSPDSVLDVGCGSGAVMAALRELGVRSIGLEYSTAAIDTCRKKGLEVHRTRIGSINSARPARCFARI